jgi:hypothetical protein
MGWSEKYWEDVESELKRPGTGAELTGGDEAPSRHAADLAAADLLGTPGQRPAGRQTAAEPADVSAKG